MNVVITGASSGIGRELAKNFAKNGHKVFAIARDKEKLKMLQVECPSIIILSLDLSSDSSKEGYLESINSISNIDILINNAGQLINKPFLKTTINDFEMMMNVNLMSAIRLIQWSFDKLKQSNKAHIVNISSMGGFQGSSKFPGLSAYSTSKGAVSILTECLASELDETNIKVNALALGAVGTEMLNNAFPGYIAPLNSKEMAEYIADFSLKGGQYFNGKVIPVALGNP